MILSAMEITRSHPTANFSQGATHDHQPIYEDAVATFFERHRACFGCPIHCSKIVRIALGPYAGAFTEGPEYENKWAFGAKRENFDIAAIIQAEYLCDYYGLDGISTGGVIGFSNGVLA